MYIHIPFCRKKCDYCGFYSVPLGDGELAETALHAYIDRIIMELQERNGEWQEARADTLYIGGGTPSMLPVEAVDRLLVAVRSSIELVPGAEITMEINSDDADPARLASYRDAGVNRMVLGVQALRARPHATIGRTSRLCDTESLAAFFGVEGVTRCADMIIGVPGEDAEGLSDDVDALAAHRPAHISAYVLSLEEGTPLSRRIQRNDVLERDQAEAFTSAKRLLEGKGYIHYEISNYALPGAESRHNMKYWRYGPYIGLGAGAHSFTGGARRCNAMGVDGYLSSTRTVLEEDRRGPKAPLAEYLMTGMRLLSGICLEEMEDRLGIAVPVPVERSIDAQASAGMIVRDSHGGRRTIKLTEGGLLFADRVIFALVESVL